MIEPGKSIIAVPSTSGMQQTDVDCTHRNLKLGYDMRTLECRERKREATVVVKHA
jgi:hypothetical protein